MKILLAVDGSKTSQSAVKSLIEHVGWYREKPRVELVTVHMPVPSLPGMGASVSKSQVQKYYEEEGESRLGPTKKQLDAAGIPYATNILVGQPAEQIVKHAKKA